MNAAPFGLDPASVGALGGALMQFVVQGTLIAGALAGTLRLLAGASAQARYLAGCAALLLMLAAPIATFFTLRAAMPGESVATLAPASSAEAAGSSIEPIATASAVSSGDPDEAITTSPAPRVSVLALVVARASSWRELLSADAAGRLIPWLVTVWSLGVAVFTVRLLGGWWLVCRLGRASHQTLDRWRAPLARLARDMGVTRAVRLCQSSRIDVPMTLGWLKPIVLLPASAVSGLSASQIEAILAHELAHIRRHDYLVNLLQSVVETLLFYHPAVWWVSRRIREERELCCDDLAVRACGDAATYARALFELEAIRAREPRLALAATGGSLVARIARLIGRPGTTPDGRGGIAATLLAAALVVMLVAAGLGVAPGGTIAGGPDPSDEPTESTEGTPIALPCEASGDCDAPAAGADLAAPAAPSEAPQDAEWSFETAIILDPAPMAAATPLTPVPPPALDLEMFGPPAPGVACEDEQPGVHAVDAEEALTPMPSLAPLAPVPPVAPMSVQAAAPRARGTTPKPTRVQSRQSRQVTRATRSLFDSKMAETWAQLYAKRVQREPQVFHLSEDQVIRLEKVGVTRDYIRRVSRQLAERPSTEELGQLFNNGVTPEYLAGLRRAGLDELTPDDARRLVSNGVTPEYVASLRGLDPDELGPDHLIRLVSHGVTAEWFSAMRWLGYSKLSVDEAIRLANHGVTPDQAGQLNAVAGRSFTPEELIRLVSNGVDADYVVRLRGRLRGDLTAEDLVRLRQNGVDPSEVSMLEAMGYTRLTAEDLVRLRQNGVDDEYVAEMLAAGLDRPSADELILLRRNGVTMDFIQEVLAAGWGHPTVEELVQMRRRGIPKEGR